MCRCYSLAHSYREHYHPSAPVFSFCIISIIKQIASFPPRSLLNNLSIIMMISNVSASNVFFCFLSHISSFIIYCYHKCHVSRVKIKKTFSETLTEKVWDGIMFFILWLLYFLLLFSPPSFFLLFSLLRGTTSSLFILTWQAFHCVVPM